LHVEECIVDTSESEKSEKSEKSEEKCIVDTSESEKSEKSEKSEEKCIVDTSESEKSESEKSESESEKSESEKFSLDEVEDELDEIQQQMKPRCYMCRRFLQKGLKYEEATEEDIRYQHTTVKCAIDFVDRHRGLLGMKKKDYNFHTASYYARRGTTPVRRGKILSELIELEQVVMSDRPKEAQDAATQTEEMHIESESEKNDSESEEEKVEEGEESDVSESENTMNKVQTAVLAIQGM
jgi:hypothetical protein